jgi:hypothetical protein
VARLGGAMEPTAGVEHPGGSATFTAVNLPVIGYTEKR